jgi:serine/threonine protein phosphatase 1
MVDRLGMPGGPAAPEGRRIYAIGDVHGELDLLRALHAQIAADAADRSPSVNVVVYLGDIVDRGPATRATIDCLLDEPLPGFHSVFLKGNHEAAMLRFLHDTEVGPSWLTFGGAATLDSYGVEPPKKGAHHLTLADTQRELRQVLPPRHLAFLRNLELSHREGDYLFVHAGIRPGVPLAKQRSDDLLWIRDEFLNSQADHGLIVVHGHTVVSQVAFKPNRIAIDTGACFNGGRLTCLVLEGATRRLLQT